MTPELIKEIEIRIAELEPKESELWNAYEAFLKSSEDEWLPISRELQALKVLLGKESK